MSSPTQVKTVIYMSRHSRKYIYIPFTVRVDGKAVEVSNVLVSLVIPNQAFVWKSYTVVGGRAKVLAAGPNAPTHVDALAVPESGADVAIQVVDEPERDIVVVGRISIR